MRSASSTSSSSARRPRAVARMIDGRWSHPRRPRRPRRPVEEAGRACAVSEPAAHRGRTTAAAYRATVGVMHGVGWGWACIGEDVMCMCVHVVDPRIAIHGPRCVGSVRMYM